MNINTRIYIIGDCSGTFRARALIDFLTSSRKYSFFYHDRRFFTPKSNKGFFSFFFKFFRIIDAGVKIPYLLFSDIVFILPMAHIHPIERLIIKLFNKYTIGEFYISMYDTYVNDRNAIDSKSYRSKMLMKRDQKFIDSCDKVIFLNASERDYYLQVILREKSSHKAIIIPLATNRKTKAVARYGNSQAESITLCWWGSYIPLHGLDNIIQAAKVLRDKRVNFKLYLFGTSEEKSKPFRKKIKELELESFVAISNDKTFSDRSLDDFLIESCDIAFGNFGKSKKAKTVMVNKVAEAASLGLPVISQKTLALNEYFKNDETICFSESEPEKIAQRVLDLMDDRALMLSIGDRAYNLYEQRFSKEAYKRDIISVLKKFD
jgi:glycosyltransferase involved in cell wall biosynthesis